MQSIVLHINDMFASEAMAGSLLDALMTQFNEVDFTVGSHE